MLSLSKQEGGLGALALRQAQGEDVSAHAKAAA
jgi:hypothetical protein